MNDTRRRPATVAVAVCIGSYARIIFVMVVCKADEARVLKRSRFKASERQQGKTPMFQAVRKNTQEAIDLFYDKGIIHDA